MSFLRSCISLHRSRRWSSKSVNDDLSEPVVKAKASDQAISMDPRDPTALGTMPGESITGKSHVKIYALGGTIVGRAADAKRPGEYDPGAEEIDTVLQAIPAISGHVKWTVDSSIFNGGSPDMTDKLLIKLAKAIERDCRQDPSIDGWVITHGTDTLEETAFFLDVVLPSAKRCEKPIVVTGAMRAANSVSPDGNMNLAQALCVASDPASRRRSVMVVFNDLVLPAQFTTKTSANSLDTFKAEPFGAMGIVRDLDPIFYPAGGAGIGRVTFDLDELDADKGLPPVFVLYGHPSMHVGLATACVKMGSRGLVLAGMGGGCWSTEAGKELAGLALPRLQERRGLSSSALKSKVPVVASFRTGCGFVGNDRRIYGLASSSLGSGFLNPGKARIQLQLCLATNAEPEYVFQPELVATSKTP